MALRSKFNLVLTTVFLAGFVAAGLVSRQLLQDNARHEVVREARLMLEAASSVRTYTVDHIRPHLVGQMAEVFLPQSVPAFAATEAINTLRKTYGEYSYKEATLNPTNPRNRPADWEADVVQRFRQYPDLDELIAERQSANGRSLFIAKPIQINNPACLQCHSTPAAAPPSMLRVYGSSNGFGWKQGEVVGAQIVTVPMAVPLAHADRAFTTFMGSLAAVFAVVFVVLNLMLTWLILQPVRRLSQAADRMSTGDFTEPEFSERGDDEVVRLGASFNRMRRSLEKAIQMIRLESRA
ncbi:c-type heme family protein [Ramlibacter sp. MAHUQ-53]|uniref:c-type heme family protein n=1 Tax=unclassified Ramlibacter TaxID=2617605 RepID=UPI00363D94E2